MKFCSYLVFYSVCQFNFYYMRDAILAKILATRFLLIFSFNLTDAEWNSLNHNAN